jgi:uncharacterized repeat protein (TIGR03847 family)
MPEIEFDPVDTVAAGAVGVPGQRTFYIQAAKDGQVVSVLVEKQQVALLAERLVTLLDQVATEYPAAELQAPGSDIEGDPVPLFRAVAIGIGFDPIRQMVVLELHERPVPDEEEEEDDGAPDDPTEPDEALLAEAIAAVASELADPALEEPEGYLARLFITPGQARALAVGGGASVQAGRPPCPLCGNPLDPEGHTCPKLNGHGRH